MLCVYFYDLISLQLKSVEYKPLNKYYAILLLEEKLPYGNKMHNSISKSTKTKMEKRSAHSRRSNNQLELKFYSPVLQLF